MDQVKIGKFTQSRRKELGYTQTMLAEKLGVSDKTISKWETGKGLPEVSLMQPLCNILNITVNDLLSAEVLTENNYKQKSEENLIKVVGERQKAKTALWITGIASISTVIGGCALIMIAGLIDLLLWQRILCLVIGAIVIVSGIVTIAYIDHKIGYYECAHCGHCFVPTMSQYVNGAHTILKRKLKCPKCGKRTWARRRLPKE
jgi:DNA-binding XRE family transcriptional regulator/DNA-directed RNA polymerase subunit RPC12/RpoP